jgi:outer membrane protein assembly factor BamB
MQLAARSGMVGLAVLVCAACGPRREADWPLPNRNLSSTRASSESGIDRENVKRLHVAWRFRFRIQPRESGVFTANPVVAGDTVYVQDMESNVFALELGTGRLRWQRLFHAGTPGPNGVAVADGRVFGSTDTTVFALGAAQGKLLWRHRLVSPTENFVDIAPQVARGLVYTSTTGYGPGTRGALYALSAETGTLRWRFSTIRGPWRYAAEAGGGGAWNPVSVDEDGRVYAGVANPTPWGGSRRRPNGGAFPGPALYTDSLLVLDGDDGRLQWFDQVTPHDIRDYDFQLSPILARVGGRDVLFGAGKAGLVISWDRRTHARLWQATIGRHKNDRGPLPRHFVDVCPGLLGGVETAMAYADGRLFVPVVELCSRGSAYGYEPLARLNLAAGKGEFLALDAASGKPLWRRFLPEPDFGCATVADGVVFTSTFGGTVYGFDARNGTTLWRTRAPAGINACPALARGVLLVGAGTTAPGVRNPTFELVAYAT